MARQTTRPRVKKKKWFPILAPKLFNEQIIGEIPLYESEAVLNRVFSVNMMSLTGNPRNQQINVIIRINKVQDGKGMTEVLGFEMMPSSVKRIVRRGRTKISDSIVIATSDNKKVRVKPLIITNTVVNNSTATSIRLSVRNALASLANKLTYDKLVEEIMSFKLQKHLGNVASNITPIKSSTIRSFRIIEKEGVRVIRPKEMRTHFKEEKKAGVQEERGEIGEEEKKEEKSEIKGGDKERAEEKQKKDMEKDGEEEIEDKKGDGNEEERKEEGKVEVGKGKKEKKKGKEK